LPFMVLFFSPVMRRYYELLQALDQWFASMQARHPEQMQCRKGCAFCCHGLFDISMADAVLVARGFEALPAGSRARVSARARTIQRAIQRQAPALLPPYLLQEPGSDRIDEIVSGVSGTACPFLGERNECLIYAHRPLACRMEGVPMVDGREGLFGDWCELNFTEGVKGALTDELALDYGGMQGTEDALSRHLAGLILGSPADNVAVFIPSVIVEFEGFWKPHLAQGVF